jgi:protein-tyrosine phosphatase
MMDSTASKFLPDLPSPSELCDTKDIENHPATQVLPHLYLGNMRDASDMAVLSRLNIRFILNVTAKTPAYTLPDGFHYKHLDAADNGQQNLRQFFEEAFDFIDEAKGAGTGVLVHCQAGISRSPTIAVAYLMKHYPMAMGDAYKFVKTRRSIISPNLNFMGQLWEFEQGLREAGGFTKESTTMQVTESNDNQTSSKKSFVAPGSTFNLGSETEAKSASAASGSASSPFMWSQSSEVSKSVDGIYSTPVMNGCSV